MTPGVGAGPVRAVDEELGGIHAGRPRDGDDDEHWDAHCPSVRKIRPLRARCKSVLWIDDTATLVLAFRISKIRQHQVVGLHSNAHNERQYDA